MNKLRIVANNKEAKRILEEELFNGSFAQKKMVKQWYEITKGKGLPFTILITIKLPMLKPFIVSAQLQDLLKTLGLKKDIDYTIEEVL